jgi:hypothetical protein
MQLKTEPKVLECLLAVNLNVNIWSARRKLNPEDFSHQELPPEGLASLGSKKICDPKELRVFGMLKARAVSLLDRSGVRFLGGWAIPEDKAPVLIQELEIIAGEFNQAKDGFMSRYDQAVQSWIKENPGWEQMIASSTVSAEYVAKRMGFSWQVFRVVNPPGQEQVAAGLNREIASLGSTLFDEIAKDAREAWSKSFLGKPDITRKALSPLKTIQQKLNDLSFIEPKVAPVAALIESALDKIPARGKIEGTQLLMIQGLVSLLSDTSALLAYAQEILEGRSKDAILDLITLSPPAATADPQQQESQAVASAAPAIPVGVKLLDSHGLW